MKSKIFLDLDTNSFLPTVCHFYQENDLPAKTLIRLDNAPGHIVKNAEVRTPLYINVAYILKILFFAFHCIFVYRKQAKSMG